jgi:hypothetical protein
MWYALFADLVVILHLAFVLFVLFGGLFTLQRPRVAWLHLPAAAWGAAVEFTGWICPLTPLEHWLRAQSGEPLDEGDFLQRLLLPLLYPEGLTHQIQVILGILVLIVNASVYGWLWHRSFPRRHKGT